MSQQIPTPTIIDFKSKQFLKLDRTIHAFLTKIQPKTNEKICELIYLFDHAISARHLVSLPCILIKNTHFIEELYAHFPQKTLTMVFIALKLQNEKKLELSSIIKLSHRDYSKYFVTPFFYPTLTNYYTDSQEQIEFGPQLTHFNLNIMITFKEFETFYHDCFINHF